MKKIFILLTAMVIALSFGSCSKKDSDKSASVSMAGKVFTTGDGWSSASITFVDKSKVQFKQGSMSYDGTYKVSGKKIVVDVEGNTGKFVYDKKAGTLTDKTTELEVVYTEKKSDKKASSKKATITADDDDDDEDLDEADDDDEEENNDDDEDDDE